MLYYEVLIKRLYLATIYAWICDYSIL